MFKLINNLQDKPESFRKKVAFSVSFVFTLLVIVVWLTTLLSAGQVSDDSFKQVSVDEVDGPVQSLGSMLGSVGASINKLTEDFRW